MIPSQLLDRKAAKQLMEYLRREVFMAERQRRPLEEKWIKYHRAYKAQPEKEIKEFPFLGAANLELPIIATDVDVIFSRLVGLIFEPENLWSTKATNAFAEDFAKEAQDFLSYAETNELKMQDPTSDWVMEICKLGTGVLKQRYRRRSKLVYEFRETPRGTLERIARRQTEDHPVVERVSLFDFLVPPGAATIEEAPWVGERLMLTWGQLQNRQRAGIYQGTDRLKRWLASDKGSEVLQALQAMDDYEPAIGDKLELWEVWLDYDIAGFGEPMSIVATVHLPSTTFLRIDFNPFLNQEKPYSVARYLRQEDRFYGIGLAEMLEQFQDEITTMHNQRIDNATLSNSTMFKGRKGSVRQDEPVFPGRWFLLDDMEDVEPMDTGRRFDSTVPYEEMALSYARRRTGVSDYVTGAASPAVGYGAATTTVTQLRQATKRFHQTLREIRLAMGETGMRVLELYQQFNQGGKPYFVLGPEEGQTFRRFMQFPRQLIRMSVDVELTVTNEELSKEEELRTNTILMELVMQFYTQLMQGMSYVVNPQAPPEIRQLALQMVKGGATLMRRILEGHGIQDTDELVPQIKEIISNGQQQLNSIEGAFAGAGPGTQRSVPPTGMAAPSLGNGGTAQIPSQTNGRGGGRRPAPQPTGRGSRLR